MTPPRYPHNTVAYVFQCSIQVHGAWWDVWESSEHGLLFRWGCKPWEYFADYHEHFPLNVGNANRDTRCGAVNEIWRRLYGKTKPA